MANEGVQRSQKQFVESVSVSPREGFVVRPKIKEAVEQQTRQLLTQLTSKKG